MKHIQRKVAIPTRNNNVDDHFGHCEYYTVYSLDSNNMISSEEKFEAPKGCGCKSEIASILKEMNVDTLLAGNMGQGAINKINASGISVYRGCSGSVSDIINDYLAGKISDSGLICSDHSGHGHGHNNGHSCSH